MVNHAVGGADGGGAQGNLHTGGVSGFVVLVLVVLVSSDQSNGAEVVGTTDLVDGVIASNTVLGSGEADADGTICVVQAQGVRSTCAAANCVGVLFLGRSLCSDLEAAEVCLLYTSPSPRD